MRGRGREGERALQRVHGEVLRAGGQRRFALYLFSDDRRARGKEEKNETKPNFLCF